MDGNVHGSRYATLFARSQRSAINRMQSSLWCYSMAIGPRAVRLVGLDLLLRVVKTCSRRDNLVLIKDLVFAILNFTNSTTGMIPRDNQDNQLVTVGISVGYHLSRKLLKMIEALEELQLACVLSLRGFRWLGDNGWFDFDEEEMSLPESVHSPFLLERSTERVRDRHNR